MTKTKKAQVKKIKENITDVEFKKLMNNIRGDETMRKNTKLNFLRTYCILYFTGLRLNEVQELRIKNIKELLENGTTKIILSKTATERKLYLSDNFKKELTKIFDFKNENDTNLIICKGSNKNKKTGLGTLGYIAMINNHLKIVLGAGYTSHSFRQGIITEMGSKGINVKIISKYIGHSDVKTTLGYISPTDTDIINCLVR